MLRWLYSFLFCLALPLIWLRLLWRARRQPEYLRDWSERHGFYAPRPAAPLIWVHAVSVGETRAAEPLIAALLTAYPEHGILLTHMTPTGRATGRELVLKHPDRITQAYLPYDLPGICRRFLAHFQPQAGLLMETEIWPNLIHAAQRDGLPMALINARLSAHSLRGYLRFRRLVCPALASLTVIGAQTAADAERLQRLGARAVQVTGNLKFDVTPSASAIALGRQWRQALGGRPIMLAASTRAGEEVLLLDALAAAGGMDPLLVLVPRHPQRFAEVAGLLAERGLVFRRRSDGRLPEASCAVWLGDSMGEMAAYYTLADLALMGGTLLPYGGQNLIEAAACGCPSLLGPHRFNFAQASEDAIAAGAARRVVDAATALVLAQQLLGAAERCELHAMRDAALTFSQAHRGATGRTMLLVRRLMALPGER